MKTLAKLLLLATLTLSSSAFAMKTIDLVDKAQMTDQQKNGSGAKTGRETRLESRF